MLRQKPQPGAWLVQSASLTGWRDRFLASPWMNRCGSRRNSPSAWSSLKLGGRQSRFTRTAIQLNSAYYISDMPRCILFATYQGRFVEWVPVTISLLIFPNGYISPTWKRHIDLPTKSITSNRCSSIMTGVPVLTIWRWHCHILDSKAGTMLTLERFSTCCLLPINGEVHAEPICYNPEQFRMSPWSAPYHSR